MDAAKCADAMVGNIDPAGNVLVVKDRCTEHCFNTGCHAGASLAGANDKDAADLVQIQRDVSTS